MTLHPSEASVAHLDLSNTKFRDVAVRDCFAQTDPDEASWLRSAEVVERFDRALRYLAAELDAQLGAWHDGDMRRDTDWAHRVRRLKRAVDTRLVEIGPLADDRKQTARGNVRMLREAIVRHRDTITTSGYNVRLADGELWAVLELVDGTQ